MSDAGGSVFLRPESKQMRGSTTARPVAHRFRGEQCHRIMLDRLFSTYRDPDSAHLLLMFGATPFLTAASLNMKTLDGWRAGGGAPPSCPRGIFSPR